MKKLIIAFSVLFLSAGMGAQNVPVTEESPDFHRVEFGFRFMPTVTAFKMRTSSGGVVQGQATLGYGIGGMVGFNFTNHVGLEAEIIYNSFSQKYKDENLERTLHVKYVNFPLLVSFNTGKSKPVNLSFVVGPQIGYNIGSRVETSGSNGQDTMQAIAVMKKGDVGFAYGAGLEFALNETRTIRLDLGFRGVFGFLDIQQPSTTGTNSKSFNVIDHNNIKTYSGLVGLTFLF
jgi:opacity protein-like surface antigen